MKPAPERAANLSPLKQAYLALEAMEKKLANLEQRRTEPIAIIGVGCRFPGGASDPESFWQLLAKGDDAIREVPADRWDVNAVYDPDPTALGKVYTRRGGYLEKVDLFDPEFFGIAPREATGMDPQQRLLLEVAWEALENAGQPTDKLSGSRTGIFVGIATNDYANMQLKANDSTRLDTYFLSGIAHSIASGRLSYILGLQGPSISIDTACSSSLVAVHLACNSLHAGETRMALAGGVNLILSPDNGIAFCKLRMLAADGHCKTFDAAADGFSEGEGCGFIVLKRLTDARADGDRILALIRGSAVNQDGPSSGLTAPNGPSQEAVIREALAFGGIAPDAVGYVEAHGTGTSLGDPIELKALAAVLKQGRPADRPFALGSVKTNIGHVQAAAGIAGLIKVVLMLQHGQIPPHLHFKTPNPLIHWAEVPAVIPTALTPWLPGYDRRIAGVSAFGFSGTNAHIVVEQAPEQPVVRPAGERPLQLLALSARTPVALSQLADRFAQHLALHSNNFADLCFTANTGRAHLESRLALLASSPQDAREQLAAFVGGSVPATARQGLLQPGHHPRIAFLFTGQGSQYVGMGRQLYKTAPVFRQTLDRCDELLRPHLGESVLDLIFNNGDSAPAGEPARIDETCFTQPALFALEYALVELWRSWGITPNMVMGHSVGEYVAACVAGVFSLEDGLNLIAERGRLMQSVPAGGMMAAVFTDETHAAEAIAPFSEQVSLAAINGPDSMVISGAQEAVEAVLGRLRSQGIKSKRLNVSQAFHSPLMDPILSDFERMAAKFTYSSPQIRLISNVSGRTAGDELTTAAYWRQHARQAVRFSQSMQSLQELGCDIFLEIGPQPTLIGMGQRCFPDDVGAWVPSMRRSQDEWSQMLTSLATLYVNGSDIDWAGLDKGYSRRKLALPTYPFQREPLWFPRVAIPPTVSQPPTATATGHPLLGARLRSALKVVQFESQFGTETFAWLCDHRINGAAVFPAAGYMEAFLAASETVLGPQAMIQDLVIHEGLVVSDTRARTAQLIVEPEGQDRLSLQLFILEDNDCWRLYAAARAQPATSTAMGMSLATIRSRCTAQVTAERHYGNLREHGLNFGPSLQGVVRLEYGVGEALGKIQLPASLERETTAYHFHPALLDACLQVAAYALPKSRDAFLPVGFESFRLLRQPPARLWSHVLVRNPNSANQEIVTADVSVYDESGEMVAQVLGLDHKRASPEALKRIGSGGELSRPEFWGWLYEVAWQPKPRVTNPQIPAVDLAQIAKQVEPQVSRLWDENHIPAYNESLAELEAQSAGHVIQALAELGWAPRPGDRFTNDSLAGTLGVVEHHRRLFARLMEILAEEGALKQVGAEWEVLRIWPATGSPAGQVTVQKHPPANFEDYSSLQRCGPRLGAVLRGQMDPLELLFPGGSFEAIEQSYQFSPLAAATNALIRETLGAIVARWPPERKLRILEVGAGTGSTTSCILPVFPAERTEYVFTDLSLAFLTKAEAKFKRFPFLRCQMLDIERDAVAQGLPPNHFDIVMAVNVLHATADLRESLAHIQQVLAPGGILIIAEVNRPQRWLDLTFGLTDGWWRFRDLNIRPSYPLLSQATWRNLLEESGFSQVAGLPNSEVNDSPLALQSILVARAPAVTGSWASRSWLILADVSGIAEHLAASLDTLGEHSIMVRQGESFKSRMDASWELNPAEPGDFKRLVNEVVGDTCAGIVHLWNLDLVDGRGGPLVGEQIGTGSVLYLAQALVTSELKNKPGVWIITRNAQPVVSGLDCLAITQTPVLGLAKTIDLEHPELGCVRIDLDAGAGPDEIGRLVDEILAPDEEREIALRGEARYVPRLVRHAPQTKDQSTPRRLEITSRGTIDNLALRPLSRTRPERGQVEVQVAATGLNFKDVLNVLGMYPGDPGPLGAECAGIVTAVGAGVVGFEVGDEVIARAPNCFASFISVSAEAVVPKPAALNWEQAAGVAIPFVTAFFALHHLGKMRAGDRVLIHAAAGGVGLAAVQLAERAGAQIFATAGNPAKRDYLKSLGVKHVLDSRSLAFASEIMELTQGQGVDIVLNSLAGEFIPTSLSLLVDHGRFLELGKSGLLNEQQVAQLGHDISYFAVDLVETTKAEPATIRSILEEVIFDIEAGELTPLPWRGFPIEQGAEAFRYMQQAHHIGKIVLTQPGIPVHIRADGSYLITGGLGGLGLVVARWLVERGARHLVLLSRQGIASESARQAVLQMEALGAQVVVSRCDISQRDQLASVLAQIKQTLLPLRGIVQAAGVLDDGAILSQDWSRFERVMLPKVDGTWYLHELTRLQPLDFFILFSSIASIFGAAGQSNYAAANMFMDVLAHRRRADGLAAQCINWGVWSTVGVAAQLDTAARAAKVGVGTITPDDGIRVLEYLLESGKVQVAAMPIEWGSYLRQFSSVTPPTFYSEMNQERPSVPSARAPTPAAARSEIGLLERVRLAPAGKQRGLLETFVQEQVCRVLQINASKLRARTPLSEMGLDSLMAIELRNLLSTRLALATRLPATLVYDYPTVEAIVDYLVQQVLSLSSDKDNPPNGQAAPAVNVLDKIEGLSDEEVDRLFEESNRPGD